MAACIALNEEAAPMPPRTDLAEVSLDLTAQDLLELPEVEPVLEVEDIGSIDPLLSTGSFVANTPSAPSDDSIEIELTAEQMISLLEGK
jgi:hypothetical protein